MTYNIDRNKDKGSRPQKGVYTMTTATYNRIRENSCKGIDTIIGAYSYRLAYDHNRECWDIFRAKTEDVSREWITPDGQIVTAWKPLGVEIV